MSVLFCYPVASPACIGVLGAASFVPYAVQCVEHGHVGRKRFLRDHVTDQTDKELVGKVGRALTKFDDALKEIVVFRGGKEVCWLPELINGSEKREDVFFKHVLKGVDAFECFL